MAKRLVTKFALMIFDSFMDFFDMYLEGSRLAEFLATNFALMIFDSFMDSFDMSREASLAKFLVANATFIFFYHLCHFFLLRI